MRAVKNPLIALITDFGAGDFFVGSIKGVICRINPSARIIDITHEISPFDVSAASFVLSAVYRYYPAKTIFLLVVDPGVGSDRKVLVVQTETFFFVAPDNGVLSPVFEKEEVKKAAALTNAKYFLSEPSFTFHGRDKMAPAAAWLSRGVEVAEFGEEVFDFKRLSLTKSRRKNNRIIGQVLYVDKFGNLITNIPNHEVLCLKKESQSGEILLHIGKREISAFAASYAFVKRGELLFLEGSVGFVEIAAREASAQRRLRAKPGDKVVITGD